MPQFALDGAGLVIWAVALGLSGLAVLLGLGGFLWPTLWRRRSAAWGGVAQVTVLFAFGLADGLVWVHQTWNGAPRFALVLGMVLAALLVMGVVRSALTAGETRFRLPLCLLIAGLGLAGWLTSRAEEAAVAEFDFSRLKGEVDPEFYAEVPDVTAWTDLGTPIPLFTYNAPARQSVGDDHVLRSLELTKRVIQTELPNDRCNCHGWTFADGQYVIRGQDVDCILAENNYVPVTDPRVGDLIIYRGEDGHVLHSGIVRAVGADGFVLVESKWGFLGRYLHEPDVQCYSPYYTYYRSERPGHRLIGLPAPPVAGEPLHTRTGKPTNPG